MARTKKTATAVTGKRRGRPPGRKTVKTASRTIGRKVRVKRAVAQKLSRGAWFIDARQLNGKNLLKTLLTIVNSQNT